MSENLLYTQNGVFKRKSLNNGILMKSNDSFTTLTTDVAGQYNISFNGTDYTFEPVTAGVGERFSTEYFHTDDNGTKLNVGTNGTIPIFVNSNTFRGLNIPSDNQRYLLKNGSWVALQKTVSEQTGLSNTGTGIIMGKNNNFKYLQTTTAGNYLVKYDGTDYTLVTQPTNISGIFGSGKNTGLLWNNNDSLESLYTKTAGDYYISFTSAGVPSLKLATTQNNVKSNKMCIYNGDNKNLSEFNSFSNLNLTKGDPSCLAAKKYMIHIKFQVFCQNYEHILDVTAKDIRLEFTNPNNDVTVNFYLTNPIPVQTVDVMIETEPLSNSNLPVYVSFVNNSDAIFTIMEDVYVNIVEM